MQLAEGWRLEMGGAGALLRAPRGAVRIDDEVAAFLAGDEPVAGWTLRLCLSEVLARLGALDGGARPEPPRPVPATSGPAVSVVVPTINQDGLLAACLHSLAVQTYELIEVIVVDGGSSLGSRAPAAAARPPVRVFESPGNRGFAHACNIGVAAASGDHVLILNDDATLEPDAVAQLVRAAMRRPRDLGAVCAKVRRADLRPIVESLGNVAGHRGFGSGRYAGFVDLGQFADEAEDLFSAAFTCVLLPREALDRVGPIDERYGFYYEDVDWSLRARLEGLRIVPAPHALAYHEGSASTAARSGAFKLRMVTRNRLVWASKVLSVPNVARFGMRYVVEDVRSAGTALAERRLADAAAAPRAWASALLQGPAIWRTRGDVARRRRVTDEELLVAAAAPPPLMDGPYPRVDGAALRGHYLHTPAVSALVAERLKGGVR
jgi:GT2 family glycosyltransferase